MLKNSNKNLKLLKKTKLTFYRKISENFFHKIESIILENISIWAISELFLFSWVIFHWISHHFHKKWVCSNIIQTKSSGKHTDFIFGINQTIKVWRIFLQTMKNIKNMFFDTYFLVRANFDNKFEVMFKKSAKDNFDCFETFTLERYVFSLLWFVANKFSR
jgi:hypothetical protein